MFLPLSVCLSAGQLKKLWTNFDNIFGGMRCVTSIKWLDFDPDHDADAGFLKEFLPSTVSVRQVSECC